MEDPAPKPTFEQRNAREFRQDVAILLVMLIVICTGIFLSADAIKWVYAQFQLFLR